MGLDFALIAHQESWRAASDVMSVLRGSTHPRLPDEELKDIFPWIPPRAVCRVELASTLGHSVRGVYIDSFIPPDQLGYEHRQDNIARVRDAAACAIRSGARIVSLGGFSSILIEGDVCHLPATEHTVFTTGNTLTVAFIVQGIRQLCALQGRDLQSATLLIVGATGDVGSGCARCLAPLVNRVILNARNLDRLRNLADELCARGAMPEVVTNLHEVTQRPDIVVCVASLDSPSLLLGRLAPDAIVCDAGYPKNVAARGTMEGCTVFYGGLGQAHGGLRFVPDVHQVLQHHPFPNVAQGCMLEGMVLALEGRFEPYSSGRGFITPERVATMERMAARHGVVLAPFHNGVGALLQDALNGATTWV